MCEKWRALAREYSTPYNYTAPALSFEKATGLAGINAPWRMPDDESHAEVESRHFEEIFVLEQSARARFRFIDKVALRRVLKLFDALLALNPGLQGLRRFRERPLALTDVLMGLTSQFNVEDIVYFVTVPSQRYNTDSRLQRTIERTERRAGARMLWKPSPDTLNRTWRAMDRDPRYACTELTTHLTPHA